MQTDLPTWLRTGVLRSVLAVACLLWPSFLVASLPCVDLASPVITAPSYLAAGASGTASVPLVVGSVYNWSLLGGSITSGQGTRQISLTAGAAGTTMLLSVVETKASGCAAAAVRLKILVDFIDTPPDSFHDFIVTAAKYAVMPGCGGGNFCPPAPVTRAQMASYLLRSERGGDYLPPPAVGIFADVPVNSPDARWIEQFYSEGITSGCNTNPLRYCPADPVTRAQMAVFILKTKYASGYAPPPCTGLFGDVACPAGFAVDWIEQIYREGITSGCGWSNYCPNQNIAKGQMAVFVVKAFGIVDPAAVWYLDDVIPTATTTLDYTGHGNTGSISVASVVTGVAGYARQFNASLDTWIYSNATPSVAIATAITLEAWVNPAGTAVNRIVNKSPNSGSANQAPGNYDFYLDTARHLVFAHESTAGTKTYVSSGTVVLNVWSHVAVAWGTGRVRFYINGLLVTDLADVGETALINSLFVRIARKADGSKYNGAIDEVKIWPYARTPRQIASSYQPQPTCWGPNPNDTLSDSAAIQACLDRGGEVRLAPGTGYVLTSGLVISRDNTVLTSTTTATRARVVASPTLQQTLVHATGRKNVAVSFMEIDGNRPARLNSLSTLCNDVVYRIAASNLAIQSSTGFAMSHNRSARTLCGAAILANGATFDVLGNIAEDNGQGWELPIPAGTAPWSDGITLEQCVDGKIASNTVIDATDVGIAILWSGNPAGSCLVEVNIVYNANRHIFAGIAFLPGEFGNTVVDGNSISAAVNRMSFGLAVGHHWNPAGGMTVGPQITNNTMNGAYVNLTVDGVAGATITGNSMTGAQGQRQNPQPCGYAVPLNYALYVPHVTTSSYQSGFVNTSYDGCLP